MGERGAEAVPEGGSMGSTVQGGQPALVLTPKIVEGGVVNKHAVHPIAPSVEEGDLQQQGEPNLSYLSYF